MSANAAILTWNLVTDYGMQASDAKPAIDTALADAKSHLAVNPNDEVVLYFPAGIWNVVHSTSPGIYVDNISGGKLTLRGESASETTLVFSQFNENGIRIRFTENVTIERMHLTRPQLYTTQGDVVSVSNGVVRMQLHDGFPEPVWLANQASSLTHERVLVPFEGGPLNPVSSSVSTKIHLTDVVDAGGGFYDFTIDSGSLGKADLLTPGQQVAMKAKTGISMVWGLSSNYATFQDIRITNSSRDGIWMRDCDHQIMRRIVIDRGDPINGRLPFFSQSADGLHVWPTQGGGNVLVEDNTIIGTADDGIAVINTDGAPYLGLYATNIIIRNNTVSMGLARSIILDLADGAEISGNTLNSISSEGLHLSGVKNTLVTNNTIVDNRQGHAILLQSKDFALPDGNVISSNTFQDANEDMHLIVLKDAANTQIEGNVVESWSAVDGYIPVNEVTPAPLTYAVNCSSVFGTNSITTPTTMPLVGSIGSSSVTVTWTGISLATELLKDSSVRSGIYGDTNYGNDTTMRVKDATGDNRQQSFLSFTVPGFVTISKATLILTAINGSINGNQHSLYQTETTWDESTITDNNKPAVISGALASWVPQDGTTHEIDVTQFISQNPGAELSFCILSDGSEFTAYATKEHSTDAYHPQLVLEPVRPVANSDSVTTDKDIAVDITLTATNADAASLTYTIVDLPANGALSGTAPNVTYTPGFHFSGSDSFTFKVNDVNGQSSLATVDITVRGVQVIDYPATTPGTVKTYKVALLMINTLTTPVADNPITPKLEFYSPETLGQIFFEHEHGARSFIEEASYGKIAIEGRVIGWVDEPTAGLNGTDISSGKDYYINLFKDYLTFADYDIFIVHSLVEGGGQQTGWLYPQQSIVTDQGTITGIGIDWMANSAVFDYAPLLTSNWSSGDAVLPTTSWSHELLHTFGITGHANSYDCGNVTLAEDGTSNPIKGYGGCFSIMGEYAFATHPDALMKSRIGWLTPEQVPEITSTGTYDIYPLVENDGQTKALVIPLTTPITHTQHAAEFDAIVIEYRTATGFDRYMERLNGSPFLSQYTSLTNIDTNGVLIYLRYSNAGTDSTAILDMNPTTVFNPDRGIKWQGNVGKFADAILPVGNTFTWNNIQVTPMGTLPSGAMQVNVTFPGSPIADVNLPAGISLYGYSGVNSIDAQAGFQTLIDNSQLSLLRWVNPANGQIKELYYTTFPSAGWVNEIGNLNLGQGYVVKVTEACTLSISGNKSTASVSHDLPAGYSIIGYNNETPTDAQAVFQPLIDSGKLELVRWVNPANGQIKELYYTTFPSAGWVNEIGNLTEGQGYIIKLNAPQTGFAIP